MQEEEPKSSVLKRILSRLPPTKQADNIKAVEAVSNGEPFQMLSFNFLESQDAKGQSFITTPFTQGEQNESSYR